MHTTYWTLWTRDPQQLLQALPQARFLRHDQVQPGVDVYLYENDDPQRWSDIRRLTTHLLARSIILHCTRASTSPVPGECEHESHHMLHHFQADEWIVTDDRLHKVVNYFKADRCDVLIKYPEVDILTFDDERDVRAEVQRRIAAYQTEDLVN